MKKETTYKDSGVDISEGHVAVKGIKGIVESTYNSFVVSKLGTFGSLFDLGMFIKNYKHPILVQSIDSVGTKLMVANMMGVHTSIGCDMVAHSCNDILCQGAKPVTFLDYIAVDKLDSNHIQQIVEGICQECKKVGIPVMGGEIAELPGVYADGEYELVGAVAGIVEKDSVILGNSITKGDTLIGIQSNGLHTNGYTLARKVLFADLKYSIHTVIDELGISLGEELLKPHRNYSVAVNKLINKIQVKGIAHITGGGLIENIPRVLPNNCSAIVRKSSWSVPPIFSIIQKGGNVPERDMYRTFNMGIGLVLIVNSDDSSTVIDFLNSQGHNSSIIGEIIDGEKIAIIEE